MAGRAAETSNLGGKIQGSQPQEGSYGKILVYANYHRIVKQDCFIFLFVVDWMLDVINLRFQLPCGILNGLITHMGAHSRSIEYADNRISLYAAQYGKCAVTGRELEFDEIHCHHKLIRRSIVENSLSKIDELLL